MNKAFQIIKDVHVFYISTIDGDRPSCRPFGALSEIDGKMYTCTSNTKAVFAQISKNGNVCLCTMGQEREWVRINAHAVVENSSELKAKMFDLNPHLRTIHSSENDGAFELIRLENGTAEIHHGDGSIETIDF